MTAAIALVVIGLALLVLKVTLDSEPGALPQLMILAGSIGLWLAGRRRRSRGT